MARAEDARMADIAQKASPDPGVAIRARQRDWSRYTQQAGLVICIVALGAVFYAVNSLFGSESNLIELLRSATLYFIVACASTLVLVGGGLDFSIGAIYALGAVVTGLIIVNGGPWPFAIVAGVAVGVAFGVVNALVSVRLRVPPLIATLGVFFVATGLADAITSGNDVYGFPNSFIDLGAGDVGGIPYLIFYAVAAGLVFHVLLERTVFGYNVRATGGNRTAAAANGIRVGRLDIWLYALPFRSSPPSSSAGHPCSVAAAPSPAAPWGPSCSPRSTTAFRSSTWTRSTRTSSSA
jgi:ribose transport system permease protein